MSTLSDRIRILRLEMYGGCGAPMLAAELGIPTRAWIGYEAGEAIPAETLLAFIQIVGARPRWLMTGEGDAYEAAGRDAIRR